MAYSYNVMFILPSLFERTLAVLQGLSLALDSRLSLEVLEPDGSGYQTWSSSMQHTLGSQNYSSYPNPILNTQNMPCDYLKFIIKFIYQK